jgi:hypothetical protein
MDIEVISESEIQKRQPDETGARNKRDEDLT